MLRGISASRSNVVLGFITTRIRRNPAKVVEIVEMKVYVIMRSTGEYSDRIETPIRYCLTEDDAKAAIELTSIQAQQGDMPEYRRESSWAWIKDGQIANWGANGARFQSLPNADQIEAQNVAWEKEYEAACLALGHVDPGGCTTDAFYSYEGVTLWTPQP